MKIVNYVVAVGNSPDQLSANVVDLIEDGWQPIGGVCVISDPDLDHWNLFQAMIRREEEKP